MLTYLKARLFGVSFESMVPAHEGKCYPTWLNQNQVMNRLDGGQTGFFKTTDGREFHGIIWQGKVYSTERVYGTFRGPQQGRSQCEAY